MRALIRVITLGIAIIYTTALQAHEIADSSTSAVSVLVKNLTNRINVRQTANTVSIESNGIPNHETGDFPRRGNPHTIKEQTHILHFTKKPRKTGNITPSKFFGVAVNGVMFVPETAECWSPEKQLAHSKKSKRLSATNRPRPRTRNKGPCDWREEAIVSSQKRLGLDMNNAHVQPNGMYHYHGLPVGLIQTQKKPDDLTHVGFAGDGFKIYVSMKNKFKSGYQLKIGLRNGGPGGVHDGTYSQDFEFKHGAGDLDECNGIETGEHGYIYLITEEFPFIPRCWKGSPHSSFKSRP
tara:strand:+ start:120 stop:1004 length:885 start_codon:yes stop_codon:yes gene_type:complete